ncbi:SAM-dependent methyltransferase [Actinoalloteichus hoggarensis]|uniref:N5-glutamine S-adenosyl-L-methionine-dependent methyltransferase n=1 Tax=Actinoalloteichus hoggarensis TaxID=1470176 RepID=A0A221W6Y3_9PSEU|nr:methyltransferase domain-containing protein [Actinoalloteichus hoggarensis]ASO21329.1 N5-glutamine S-adenosyl-L-methionine-dependent methyltransferase [Actinoalloteichus hoggarensis]MBB5921262.1 SAM-dependent methyltransferase [Actinoalloteichus hoggarensis]
MELALGVLGEAIGRQSLAASRTAGERMVVLLGRTWVVQADVYSPACSPSTEISTAALPYPAGGRLLEIGSGCGITAVHGLLHGLAAAVAVDVSPAAVANTRLNAEVHGVAERLTVVCGSVFEPLDADDRFDVVFWNAPFIEVADDHVHDGVLSTSYFDPGLRGMRAFVSGVRSRLTSGGRAFLGLDDIGGRAALCDVAAEHGWRLRVAACETAPRRAVLAGMAVETDVDHLLLELVVDDSAAGLVEPRSGGWDERPACSVDRR